MASGQWSVVAEVPVAGTRAVPLVSPDPAITSLWIVGSFPALFHSAPPEFGSPQVMDTSSFAIAPFTADWAAAAVFAPDTKTMVWANRWASRVTVYDGATKEVTQIPVDMPLLLATTSDPTKVFAANAGTLFRIDLQQKSVSELTPPEDVSSMTGVGSMLYCANMLYSAISIVDAANWCDAGRNISLPEKPFFITASPDGRFLIANYWLGSGIVRIDLTELGYPQQTLDVPAGAGLAVSHDGSYLFVADNQNKKVHVVDLASLTIFQSIPVPAGAYLIAVSPDDRHLYVTSDSTNFVSIIQRQP